MQPDTLTVSPPFFRRRLDLRLLAAAIAVGLMLWDDLPRPNYGTGHDPGAAAMLSILFANSLTQLMRRSAWIWVHVGLVAALFVKPWLQMFFWVRNATVVDLAVLLAGHTLLGWLAVQGSSQARARRALAGLLGTGLALALAGLIGLLDRSWLVFWWQLAFARIAVPVLFWTAVGRACRNVGTETQQPVCREG